MTGGRDWGWKDVGGVRAGRGAVVSGTQRWNQGVVIKQSNG